MKISKIKKRILTLFLLICLTVTSVSAPIFESQTVSASAIEAPGVSVDWIYRVIVTLLSKAGIMVATPYVGGSSAEELVDCYARSFTVYKGGGDPGPGNGRNSNEWNFLMSCGTLNIILGLTEAFPQFMDDLLSNVYSDYGIHGYQDVETGKQVIEYIDTEVNDCYRVNLSALSYEKVADDVSPDSLPLLDDTCTLSWHKANMANYFPDLDSDYYLFVRYGNYSNFFQFSSNSDTYISYDPDVGSLVTHMPVGACLYNYRFFLLGQTMNSFVPSTFTATSSNSGNITLKSMGTYINGDIYTNLYIRIYADGSINFLDPDMMSPSTFKIVEGGIADVVKNRGISWKDVEIADSFGVPVSDPASAVAQEVNEDVLTIPEIDDIVNNQTDLNEYVKKSNAINKETNEQLGDVNEELDTQTGIFQKILNISKNIFNTDNLLLTNFRHFVTDLKLDLQSILSSLNKVFTVYIPGFDDLKEFVHNIQAYVVLYYNRFLDGFANVVNAIKEQVLEFPDTLTEAIQTIKTKVMSIPDALSDIAVNIVDIFVPSATDLEAIKNRANQFSLSHFGVNGNELEDFFVEGKSLPDFKWKGGVVFSGATADSWLTKIRPWLQGALWLLVVFFIYNQILGIVDKKGVTQDGSD